MWATKIVFICTIGGATFAQSGAKIMGGSASTDKAGFSYETRLEPPAPPLAAGISGGVQVGKSGIHRIMTDSAQRKYFGYDIDIHPAAQANTYQVSLRPLSVGPDKIGAKDAARWTLLSLPAYPAPQTVHGGDTIALDLFTNAATGQKIVDYIRMNDNRREIYTVSGPARDFTVADAELRLMDPRLSINSKPSPATANQAGGVSGAAIWFSVPDLGRYYLSLVPRPDRGFQKAGEIRGNVLTFKIDGDTITLDCNGRIVPGKTAYNLYVFHDAAWRPGNPEARHTFGMTAGDRLEALLPR